MLESNENGFEKTIKFVQDDLAQDLEQIFGTKESSNNSVDLLAPQRDYKVVTPQPGFCIKSFKTNTNEKYFINVCKSEDIPAPKDITEKELTEILNSDSPSNYRIPMSIAEPRNVRDNSNNLVEACDIAINPYFFTKCAKSVFFKEFFLAIISEALSEKYNVQINIEKSIILNNRKFIGNLVSHRVRNSDVEMVLDSHKSSPNIKELISYDPKPTPVTKNKKLVEEINQNEIEPHDSSQHLKEVSAEINRTTPIAAPSELNFKFRGKILAEKVVELQAEFHLPKCVTSDELSLNVGEDRILLESLTHGYLFDNFFNYRLDRKRVMAIFDKTHKMLQVRVPILSN